MHAPENQAGISNIFPHSTFFFFILKTTKHLLQTATEKVQLKKKFFPFLLFNERRDECVYHMEMRKNQLEKPRKYGVS